MTHAEDVLAITVQNAISYAVVAISFQFNSLIPPPERIVEWLLGATVAISMIAYNCVRLYQALKSGKHKE